MNFRFAILRIASWLAPAEQREEWLAEWIGELTFVGEHCAGASTMFCLGAFRDALWLRRNDRERRWRGVFDSPVTCLAFMAIATIACSLFAFQVPRIRALLVAPTYRDAGTVVMIAPAGRSGSGRPEITFDAYKSITSRAGNLFGSVAFYQSVTARVDNRELTLASASANLFDVLNVRVPSGAQLILSEHAWHNRFHTMHPIIGRLLEVDGQFLRVAAVLRDNSWRLPQRVDGWVLDNGRLAGPDSKRFLVGRRIHPQNGWRAGFALGSEPFECVALGADQPLSAVLLSIALALLILPAVTTLSPSEYPSKRRLRRWGFLVLKIGLILPLVFFCTLDASFILAPVLVPFGLLIGYFAGFRWALADQRRRCPVCLRRLACPTRIGCSSNVLLDWCGTELICTRGHGLLHVPEILVSSYSMPRWMQLDSSWSGLFVGRHVAPFGS